MKVLFLSRWYPYPTNNGSKLRIYNLLRGLAQKHQVTLLSFVNPTEVPADLSGLETICSRVELVPYKPFNPNRWHAQLALFNPKPRWAVETYSLKMDRWIQRLLHEENFDAIIASQVDMAVYAGCFNGVPALFEEVEVGALYERFALAPSAWSRFRYGLTWGKHWRYLARLLAYFRACTVVSEREKELLSAAIPLHPNIYIMPNCVNMEDYASVAARKEASTLIFTGSLSYGPNYDAMLWFLQEIYPRVQAEVPDVRLIITGDPAGRSLPPVGNVELTGFVDNLHSLLASSTVSLVPIRYGGGTRLKILEAMALRTPVVSTSKGAEGLDVSHGEDILLADSAEAFAGAVAGLLQEPDRGRHLAENAHQLVCMKYDWGRVMPDLLKILERMVLKFPA